MTEYYIGTSGWHYEDWLGRFYPEKLPRTKWLEYYARHFNTVELNNSFYRLPSEKAFQNWHDTTPTGFVFSLKMSRLVTHLRRLKDCDEAVRTFIDRAGPLGRKMGPLLYQLPPGFHRDDAILSDFLKGLPPQLRHAVEFRHESWLNEEVYNILNRHHTGLCVFNMPSLTAPLRATSDFGYIRFHGSQDLYATNYSDEELAEWADGISALARGLEAVFIYFNNDVQGFAVKNAITLRSYLKKGRAA